MLKPEISLPVALGTGAVVVGIYTLNMPGLTDVKGAPAGNPHVAGSRKVATWESIGLVGVLSLLTKDPVVFLVGGLMVVGMDFAYRHANVQDPQNGKVMPAAMTPSSSSSAYSGN